MYDPAFYLPLLSQVASEKNLGWKLAGSGALALALAALASSDPEVRSAAYHVLHRMYTNIEEYVISYMKLNKYLPKKKIINFKKYLIILFIY